MAYNIKVMDKLGDYATILVSPDRKAIVTKDRVATDHQQNIEWQEQAAFSKTLERKKYLENLLLKQSSTVTTVKKHHPQLRSGTGVQKDFERLDSRLRGNDVEKNSTRVTESIIAAFHQPSLYLTNYQQDFGTVYTAIYKPQNGSMSLAKPTMATFIQTIQRRSKNNPAWTKRRQSG